MVVLSLGAASPIVIRADSISILAPAALFWPAVGVTTWGVVAGPSCLGAILIPIAMLIAGGCFVRGHHSKDALWVSFSLSVLFTAPVATPNLSPLACAAVWLGIQCVYFGLPRIIQFRQT